MSNHRARIAAKPTAETVDLTLAVTAIAFLLSVAMLTGCAQDNPGPTYPAPPDTSVLRVIDLSFTAFDDRGAINSGLTMQWWEHFYSNYNKNCLIERYVILDPRADTIFGAAIGSPAIGHGIIPSGEKHYARTKKIDVADSAVAGLYALHILYRHSNTNFHWDTTIHIVANQNTDTTGTTQ
jgi:hypothetical protein